MANAPLQTFHCARAAKLLSRNKRRAWVRARPFISLTLLQHVASLTGADVARAGSNSLLLGHVKAVPAAVMGLVLPQVAT